MTHQDRNERRRNSARLAVGAMLALGACTYNLDPTAIQDLRAQQEKLGQAQSAQAAAIADIERKQAEQDGKLRVLFQHGK